MKKVAALAKIFAENGSNLAHCVNPQRIIVAKIITTLLIKRLKAKSVRNRKRTSGKTNLRIRCTFVAAPTQKLIMFAA